jgi:hypothetical protein
MKRIEKNIVSALVLAKFPFKVVVGWYVDVPCHCQIYITPYGQVMIRPFINSFKGSGNDGTNPIVVFKPPSFFKSKKNYTHISKLNGTHLSEISETIMSSIFIDNQ